MEPESTAISAIVLAAGQGTRMRSALPKPVHEVCGRPMVCQVVDVVAPLHPTQVTVVVGHGADQVINALQQFEADHPMVYVEQREQRGTGDAVTIALAADENPPDDDVIVLPGDAPLLRASTLGTLVAQHQSSGAAATMLTARLDDPTGYGRVIRLNDGQVTGVVEQGDATDQQREINEVNTSMYVFRRADLTDALNKIDGNNAQGELYLTDVIGILHGEGKVVRALVLDDPIEAQGVNDRAQLAAAQQMLRIRINGEHLQAGVTMIDPESTFIEPTVTIEPDTTLHPGTILRGATRIARGSIIGPHTELRDTTVGAHTTVSQSVATRSTIGERATVGPYAVLEAGSRVGDDFVTGPFARLTADADALDG